MLIPSPSPLPVEGPTTSYWQKPFSRLQKHRTTPQLPAESEYVIIGGGISGSSLAYRILDKKPDAKVLLLEARDACSGASGRNGGHCRPGRYTTFIRDRDLHGAKEAAAIARFEEANCRQLVAFAQDHQIDCSLESVTTADIFEAGTESAYADVVAAIMVRKLTLLLDIEAGKADDRIPHTAAEAREKFQTPTAIGAVSFPSHTLNPYRFVCGLLELALRKGLNLQTGTPVQRIASEGGVWTVHTPHGTVTTRNVLLATNGYTSHLLSSAARFIMPVRLQALAIRSGSTISRTPLLPNHSLGFVYPTDEPGVLANDYMASKPVKTLSSSSSTQGGRDLIFGGGRHLAPNNEHFNTDDSSINAAVSQHLHTALQTRHFGRENWGEDSNVGPDGVLCEWTGIAGYTADENPVLGRVPHHPGLWICAGFTGHGMALAFRSADAVSSLVLGCDDEVTKALPDSFLCGRRGCEVLVSRR